MSIGSLGIAPFKDFSSYFFYSHSLKLHIQIYLNVLMGALILSLYTWTDSICYSDASCCFLFIFWLNNYLVVLFCLSFGLNAYRGKTPKDCFCILLHKIHYSNTLCSFGLFYRHWRSNICQCTIPMVEWALT